MASDVMSLFGMDPNVIQQNRVQQGVDNAARMSADYAIGAASGGLAASGINSAFGLQTPDMAQAASVQAGLQGADLTTVAGLRAAAQQLMMNGDYPQAMALHAQARDMEALENKAPSVSSQKTYMTPDGKELVGYVVDGVPSYRKDGAWIPLPDGSTIKDTSGINPFNITGTNIDEALVEMDRIGIDLSRKDKNSAARWIANRSESLQRDNKMRPNDALAEATREAQANYIKDGGWFGLADDTWNPPAADVTAAQPAAIPSGYEVITYNGKQYARHKTDKTKPIITL
jgi:hypothetical protein